MISYVRKRGCAIAAHNTMSMKIGVKESKSIGKEIKQSYKIVLFVAFVVFLNNICVLNIKQ